MLFLIVVGILALVVFAMIFLRKSDE